MEGGDGGFGGRRRGGSEGERGRGRGGFRRGRGWGSAGFRGGEQGFRGGRGGERGGFRGGIRRHGVDFRGGERDGFEGGRGFDRHGGDGKRGGFVGSGWGRGGGGGSGRGGVQQIPFSGEYSPEYLEWKLNHLKNMEKYNLGSEFADYSGWKVENVLQFLGAIWSFTEWNDLESSHIFWKVVGKTLRPQRGQFACQNMWSMIEADLEPITFQQALSKVKEHVAKIE